MLASPILANGNTGDSGNSGNGGTSSTTNAGILNAGGSSTGDSGNAGPYGRLISQSESLIVADVWLTDARGNVLAQARRLSLQAIDMATKAVKENPFYRMGVGSPPPSNRRTKSPTFSSSRRGRKRGLG